MKIEQVQDKDTLVVKLIGSIDEDTLFPKLNFQKEQILTFDFSEVSHINSCGIREWISWAKSLAEVSKLMFRLCPKVIIDQVNTVEGFLPKNGTVESFYVPYYCKACGKTTSLTFETSKVITDDKINVPQNTVCTSCKSPKSEVDVLAKYFSFLGDVK